MTTSEYPLQPLTLIKAGAGAGKTFTVQSTLTSWIRKKEVRADRILAVTFTNAAASEMRSRIRLALIKAGLIQESALLQKSTISTIHAFGLEVLERFAFEQGLSPAPRQLGDQEKQLLIREALNQVEAAEELLQGLQQYGYTGGFAGDDFKDGGDQLIETILVVVNQLRSLGKDATADSEEAQSLMKQAQQKVQTAFGNVQEDGPGLTDDLWSAIEAVRKEYPDINVLKHKDEWGNNADTRDFVTLLYSVTRQQLEQDWKVWSKLQYTVLLKKIAEQHPRADLANAVWNAAEELNAHPGPLAEGLRHVELLLTAALSAMHVYQQKKQAAGLVDFNDMVYLAHQLLAEPEWLDEITAEYDCLIIDEFQDTNPLQYALLRRFQQKEIPTFIVGDLKQSIMGFQGSDRRLFESLLEQQKDNDNVVSELSNNWRSTPKLMEFINQAGYVLYEGQYQELEPKNIYESQLPALQVLNFVKDLWIKDRSSRSEKPAFRHEGNFALANHISNLLSSNTQVTDRHTNEKRPIRPGDIAVLAQGHNRLKKFAAVLRDAGIEVQILEPGFLECEAVQWVLNALQTLNNSRDHYALLNLLTSPLVNGNTSENLQALLQGYIQDKKFNHNVTEELEPLRKTLRSQPIKMQLLQIIDAAKLFETIKTQPAGNQYRANLIKLLALATTFEEQQPESLHALGVSGKNAATFQLWLKQSKEAVDEQPVVDAQADSAVVLSTWHASKGLEWPVVMILSAEDIKKPRFPNVSMAYAAGDIDSMLNSSHLQILPPFADKTTQEKMAVLLKEETTATNKNLYYVALTRAREQIILPSWEDYSDGSMLSCISPVLKKLAEQETDEANSSLYAERNVMPSEADSVDQASIAHKRTQLVLNEKQPPSKLKHTFNPSVDDKSESTDVVHTTNISEQSYGTGFDLNTLGYTGQANELGTWMHRIYQVYLLAPEQPELLKRALEMQPCPVQDPAIEQAIQEHLQNFRASLETLTGGVKQMLCEVPVTGLNHKGQVISGVIDLLVESESGEWWIIDHKTDQEAVSKGYWEQLQAYAVILRESRTVAGSVLHWTRHEKLSVLR